MSRSASRLKWLALCLFVSFLLAACGEGIQQETVPQSLQVQISLPEGSSAGRFKGTFSEIEHIQLEVRDNGSLILVDNVSLQKSNNVWFGSIDNVTTNVPYNFFAQAYSDNAIKDNTTKIFEGQTTQVLNNSNNILQIRMTALEETGAASIPIPQIRQILYKPNVTENETQRISVEVGARVNDNLTWKVSKAKEITQSYVALAPISSFQFDYSSPDNGTKYFTLSVRNQLDYTVTSSFSITVGDTETLQPALLFQPIVLSLTGTPEGENQIRWSAVVTDDGPLGNLSAHWSFNPAKNFTDNSTDNLTADNVTFRTLMPYNPSENGTLTLQILGTQGDNISLDWAIGVNQFPVVNQVSSRSRFQQLLSVGQNHACQVRTDNVSCWGLNASGQLGDGTTTDNFTPQVLSLGQVRSVSVGDNHSCALLANPSGSDNVSCWGLTAGIAPDNGTPAWQLSSGDNSTCLLYDNGSLGCWGLNGTGTPTASNFLQVDVGQEHACAVHDNGSVSCWGTDSQTNGKRDNASSVTRAVQVSAGGEHSCAVRDNGSLTCWGANEFGQLGVGDNNTQTSAVEAKLSNVALVSAGARHTCALLTSGAIRCWGANESGQLGNLETGGYQDTPGYVDGGAFDVRWLAAGDRHSCMIQEDNSTACWGDNQTILGNEPAPVLSPQPIDPIPQ